MKSSMKINTTASKRPLPVMLAAMTAAVAALALCALSIGPYSIPKLLKRDSTFTLVLSGIIVGGFCGSILGIIKYLADPETELPEIVY